MPGGGLAGRFRRDRGETDRVIRLIGATCANALLGIEQELGPAFILRGCRVRRCFVREQCAGAVVPQGIQIGRQLALLALQLGQLSVQVKAVEVQVVVDPESLVTAARAGRGSSRDRTWFRFRLLCGQGRRRQRAGRIGVVAQQMMCGIEYLHAGTTACRSSRCTELAAADAKAGTAVGTLGDEAGHARFRANVPASLAHADRQAAVARRHVRAACGCGRRISHAGSR